MKKFRWIKVTAFFMVLATAVGYVVNCYSFPKSYISRSYEAFYDEPEGVVDGVVFGTSVVANGWAAPVAWQENGMAVYQLGGTVQPFGVITRLIDFARSQQDIKYVVIDIHGLRSDAVAESAKPVNTRRVYSALHFGKHQYAVMNAALDYAERVYSFYGEPENKDKMVSKDDISYYIPFINFHNRWVDEGLEEADYISVPSKYKGAMDLTGAAFKTTDNSSKVSVWQAPSAQIDDFQKEVLDELFSYLEESGLQVLFINYPTFNSEEEHGELKAIAKYIGDNGYDIIDMCSEEMLREMGVDAAADFRDEGHLNSKGAYKVTKYLCSYIRDNYYYEDHRGEEGYESWDKAAEDYSGFVNNGWEKAGDSFRIKQLSS